MTHRPRAPRIALIAVLSALLLGTLASSAASAETQPTCRHPQGARCVAARHAQRAALRAAHWAAIRLAPTLSADGDTLTWSAVPGIDTYVLVRIVPGKPRVRHVVTGTSFTPREVPGAEYIVRPHVARSHWSSPVSIAYDPKTSRRGLTGNLGSEGSSGSQSMPSSGSGSTPGSGSESTPSE
jgi:hypothetical protein